MEASDDITIHPPKYDLAAMLKAITMENIHHQDIDGDSRGNEEW